jgi:ATP-dependent DNA helicase RecQ
MTVTEHLAEQEYEHFRSWLLEPTAGVEFLDSADRRLVDVLGALEHGAATPLELAVLLRQHARRWSLERGTSMPLETRGMTRFLTDEAVAAADLIVTSHGDRHLVSARAWEPEWLDIEPGTAVDDSAAAGIRAGERRRAGSSTADPIFTEATGFPEYKTPGQRAAVRMVLEMDPSGVMIANLPTGSGKTEVAVTLARSLDAQGGGTVVMVVPTIALAQDLEARLRVHWTRTSRRRVDMSTVPFAWTSETKDEQRDQLRGRVMTGKQPLVVTSPESLAGALLETIRTGAGTGRVRALVVDEAHLITQWGRSFRPEFRLLGGLWRELNTASELGVRAVLLSATMNADVVADLLDVFRAGCGPSIVAANAIRAEPSFWVAGMSSFEERERRVLEALAHLPRPCILYVTQPRIASRWIARLHEAGYRRIIDVTGESPAGHRREALDGLRTSSGPSQFDIVVATAAFGLGIDADEIRTIVHACLPETADRWYQEVGRAGRDGYASTALLVPAFKDKDEALSLGVRVLTPDLALARWDAMWTKRRDIGGRSYVNLRHAPQRTSDGSYNRRWNAQTLDGLTELDALKRTILSWDESRALGLLTRNSGARSLPDAWQEIALQGPAPDASFFGGRWTRWKDGVERAAFASVAALEQLIQTRNACAMIEAAYRPSPELTLQLGPDAVRGFGISTPCGRCQACRRAGRGDELDPAPDPSIRWADNGARSDFETFVDAHVFGQGSAIGVLDRTSVVEADGPEARELVPALVAAGVRLGAGRRLLSERLRFPYFDERPDPISMQPIPAVVACEDPQSLGELLALLRLRPTLGDGRPAPVLVQVSGIPRDLRAQRPLTAGDVRSLLED